MGQRDPAIDELAARLLAAALKEAWVQASADYWLRRAVQFEASAPRPGDFIGRKSTPEQRAERERLRQRRIEACRYRAAHVEGWAIAGLAEALELLGSSPADQRTAGERAA